MREWAVNVQVSLQVEGVLHIEENTTVHRLTATILNVSWPSLVMLFQPTIELDSQDKVCRTICALSSVHASGRGAMREPHAIMQHNERSVGDIS